MSSERKEISRIAPDKKEKHIQDKLLELIEPNEKGLTINELVSKSRFTRETVSKHLQLLLFQNEIYEKKFGNVGVYYPNHKKLHSKDTETLKLLNRTIYFDRINNEYGDFVRIKENRLIGNKWENKGSVIFPREELEKVLKKLKMLNKRDSEIKTLNAR